MVMLRMNPCFRGSVIFNVRYEVIPFFFFLPGKNLVPEQKDEMETQQKVWE